MYFDCFKIENLASNHKHSQNSFNDIKIIINQKCIFSNFYLAHFLIIKSIFIQIIILKYFLYYFLDLKQKILDGSFFKVISTKEACSNYLSQILAHIYCFQGKDFAFEFQYIPPQISNESQFLDCLLDLEIFLLSQFELNFYRKYMNIFVSKIKKIF
ncbi:unnamed protein product [Paramecium sonneborni]|uniref:Uncharacterized protein n=1 Tax=Paramecium sonneborni TaxID=65129 RepID=A0A8S1MLB9_9CILI|nr:unnamed protein product [Paramecium sonneborni]